ncbi:hypothetical protein GOODEAATRI_011496, partial [Goodea atripinnis]
VSLCGELSLPAFLDSGESLLETKDVIENSKTLAAFRLSSPLSALVLTSIISLRPKGIISPIFIFGLSLVTKASLSSILLYHITKFQRVIIEALCLLLKSWL